MSSIAIIVFCRSDPNADESKRSVDQEAQVPESPWYGAQVVTAGNDGGITDLRYITQPRSNPYPNLVTLGVWGVLIVLLREWIVSTYLIFTVLLSYFSTIGNHVLHLLHRSC